MSILFEHLFKEHILHRGWDYYRAGRVVERQRKANEIRAVVRGTEDYALFIKLEEGGIVDLDCTCPYFAAGHNCKHLAGHDGGTQSLTSPRCSRRCIQLSKYRFVARVLVCDPLSALKKLASMPAGSRI